MKQTTSASSYEAELVLWDNLEGWDAEGGERGAQDGGTHVYPWLIHVND